MFLLISSVAGMLLTVPIFIHLFGFLNDTPSCLFSCFRPLSRGQDFEEGFSLFPDLIFSEDLP